MKINFQQLAIFIFLIIVSGIIGYYIGKNSSSETNDFKLPYSPTKAVCTMEARICPDGTAVGRTGANCEFSPCPEIETQ